MVLFFATAHKMVLSHTSINHTKMGWVSRKGFKYCYFNKRCCQIAAYCFYLTAWKIVIFLLGAKDSGKSKPVNSVMLM